MVGIENRDLEHKAMPKAVFITKISPTYDDLPEEQYHQILGEDILGSF